ncbi:MAG: DUF192 domain-containing protein [Peptococcia bacterium]|jgi:uncharacterized membrane protein (UPF0127 family)
MVRRYGQPVQIYRQEELIGGQIWLAADFFRRLKGLLLRKELKEGEGLLLIPCRQVHTFLMSFAIDVLFLDAAGTIVEILPEMVPGKMSPLVKEACQVLELPAGTVKKKKLQKGEQLFIQNITTEV